MGTSTDKLNRGCRKRSGSRKYVQRITASYVEDMKADGSVPLNGLTHYAVA